MPDEQSNRSFIDYYETLQVSPNADSETIERVYRILAKRYHPDNNHTGDAEKFRMLAEAFRVLSDSEKRAAYDVKYDRAQAHQWRIFVEPHRPTASRPTEGYKRESYPCYTTPAGRMRRIQEWESLTWRGCSAALRSTWSFTFGISGKRVGFSVAMMDGLLLQLVVWTPLEITVYC